MTAPDGSEVILLVDDEPAMRETTALMLRRLGYMVIDAAGPEDVLALPADVLEGVDALVTDVVMPGMNGGRLALKLRERRADLRTIFISGYSPEQDVQDCLRNPATVFVAKPFTLAALSAAIRRTADLG